MTLTTIDNKILFLRAIDSLPSDIKQFEIWPRIVGPPPISPPAPPAPRKPCPLSRSLPLGLGMGLDWR